MVTKQEIEEAIRGKDDFIRIDYLNRYLKQADNLDMKRFILLNLAAANESKGLLHDAIRNVSSAGDISITFREKRELYMKEVGLWIKVSDFQMAEKAYQRAMSYGNDIEQLEMTDLYENTFRAIGKSYEDSGKLRNALEVYEKLFAFTKVLRKKENIRDKLLDLYMKLGRSKEYNRLKGMIF